MKLFLFLCSFLVFQKSALADFSADIYDFQLRSALQAADYNRGIYDERGRDQEFDDDFRILPRIRCEKWRCRLSFPGFLGIIPQWDIEVGVVPAEIRVYGQLWIDNQLRKQKTIGLGDISVCIPFTTMCFKITYVRLPWGPICSEFNGRPLPCLEFNGWIPHLAWPEDQISSGGSSGIIGTGIIGSGYGGPGNAGRGYEGHGYGGRDYSNEPYGAGAGGYGAGADGYAVNDPYRGVAGASAGASGGAGGYGAGGYGAGGYGAGGYGSGGYPANVPYRPNPGASGGADGYAVNDPYRGVAGASAGASGYAGGYGAGGYHQKKPANNYRLDNRHG